MNPEEMLLHRLRFTGQESSGDQATCVPTQEPVLLRQDETMRAMDDRWPVHAGLLPHCAFSVVHVGLLPHCTFSVVQQHGVRRS